MSSNDCEICSVFKQCGACELLDIPYADQLARKQRDIAELFGGIAPDVEVQPVLGMEEPFHYRNKVTAPYAPAKGKNVHKSNGAFREKPNGGSKKRESSNKGDRQKPDQRILTGMYAKGTHRIVPTDSCLIENRVGTAIALAVRDIMQKWNITPYDEDSGKGFMRHAVIRVAQNSGEVLVTLVTNSESFPNSRSFARQLVKRVPQITTIVQNVNLRQTNVILGEKEHVLYGPGFILDTLCGLSLRISSQSFYQVNSAQTEVLYSKAIEMAHLTGEETVLDAYCGTGTIGLVAAKRGAADVIGVECVPSAVEDAIQNARHNGIENARFVVADATDFMLDSASDAGAGFLAGEDRKNMVLMMDPPRAGATKGFLEAAEKLSPSRIVYISCNPKTQIRDVAHLVEHGYRAVGIQPVDMFPHTDHIENIVGLIRCS